MAVGRIASTGASVLFGWPGNPRGMVGFYTFVRDALLAMSGATVSRSDAAARCTTAIRKRPGRKPSTARHRVAGAEARGRSRSPLAGLGRAAAA